MTGWGNFSFSFVSNLCKYVILRIMRVYEEFIDKMRIRLFIVSAMMMPVVFLFGLESYLERYDVHTKYLSQLKDTLLLSMSEKGSEIESAPGIIARIESGNFSEAAACLRAGNIAEQKCRLDRSKIRFKSISNIDILKGGYKKRDSEYIEHFKDKVINNDVILSEDLIFDFNYGFLSNKDIQPWQKFNREISSKRFGYYSSVSVNRGLDKVEYINGGSVFEPNIFYSNAAPIEGGRIRILAISDSFGAGAALLSTDDTWAKELEFQLNKIEDKYEVVVLAHGGAGYKDFLNWVEEGYIEAIDPDLVLLSFFENDFNLLHDFGGDNNSFNLLNFDKELVFYLRCFEKEDDFIGKSLKRLDRFYPSIYRYYKFSNCSDELSRYDGNGLINTLEIVNTYKDIDTLIKVPTYLFKIESVLDKQKIDLNILEEINKNGFRFINNSAVEVSNNSACNLYSSNFKVCEDFKANKFDGHFNRYYYKKHIEDNIVEIKNSIDRDFIYSKESIEGASRINKSADIIVDYLPNTLFVSNSRESATVALLKGESYGFGVSSENFCVPFDRKGVVLNFNRYLTEGKEIKISSEFQRSGLGLVSRGYDKEGKEVYGAAIELLPGKPVRFIGSESVRGIVVLSNNKSCGSSDRDNKDEFLLEVEVL